MDRILTAKNILMCGIIHGRDYLRHRIGPQIDQVLLETFSELHKNNTPEEAFVFLMVKLFNKRYPSVSTEFKCSEQLEISAVLEYIKFTPEYREARRINEITDVQMNAVLDDFSYILSKQFFYKPEVYDLVMASLKE